MDLVRFFLVSYHWLVGVSTNVIPYQLCTSTFLSNIGNGSVSSDYTPTAAVTCEMLWLNNSWYNDNIFVGLNSTKGCPAKNHCSNQTPLWMKGTLPVSNSRVSKHICKTNATGCCENITDTDIRNCTPFLVYFHRNSTSCDKAYCYENRPYVTPTPGASTSGVVLQINTGYGTTRSGNTYSVSPINIGIGTNTCGYRSLACIPIWLICLIAIASIICLTLGLILLWRKVNLQRKTHDVDDPARTQTVDVNPKRTMKPGQRIKK